MSTPTAGSDRWDGHKPRTPADYTSHYAGVRVGQRVILHCSKVYVSPSGKRGQVWQVKCDCGNVDTLRGTACSIRPKCRSCADVNEVERFADRAVDLATLHGLIGEARERCPEVWDGDSDESIEACTELAELLRRAGEPATFETLGALFGVTKERVRQIESAALKKCRLRGGQELRESWEHVQSRTGITWAEATDLIAWGIDDEDEDEGES